MFPPANSHGFANVEVLAVRIQNVDNLPTCRTKYV